MLQVQRLIGGWRPRSLIVPWAAWSVAGATAVVASLTAASVVLGEVLALAIGGACIVAMAVGVRYHGSPKPLAWVLLIAALSMFVLGDLAFTLLEWAGDDAFPSLADALYLAGYPLFLLGLLSLFREPARTTRGVMLDSLILTVGVGVLFWEFLIEPSVADVEQGVVAVAVAVAYPLFDLALLGVMVRLLLGSARNLTSFRLLALGTAAYLSADVVYASQSLTGSYAYGVVDAGWLAGYVLWAAAALHGSISQPVRPSEEAAGLSRRRLVVLAVATSLPSALALAGWLATGQLDVVVVASSAVLFVLVLARLAGIVASLAELIADKVRLQARLEHQALHDPLTELPNRRLLAAEMDRRARAGEPGGFLLLLDLDDFKTVNDSLGHPVGDALLVALARRLASVVRKGDLVGRLGGDEFAIFAPDGTSADAASVARRILASLAEPLALQHATIRVHASIGIALAGGDASPETMMRNADIAMYLAKNGGKNRFEVYRPTLHEELVSRLALRTELESALDGNEFALAYQPIVDLVDGRAVAHEALLRWRHPERGLLLPLHFLGAAEESPLIAALTRWALGEAARTAATWSSAGQPARVSVNVSPRALTSGTIVDDVVAALTAAQLPAKLLTLEITEGALVDELGGSAVLGELRALGVELSIDDFGTGYSSLDRIARLSVDEIKVDRAFVAAPDDGVESRLLAAMVQLGRALGVRVVAEGIETPAQARRMADLGCRFGQGFLFGVPTVPVTVPPVSPARATQRTATVGRMTQAAGTS